MCYQGREYDRYVNPKRMAVVMRWNRIGHEGVQRELGCGGWYYQRLMAGIESPDGNDMRQLNTMFGNAEMDWVLGRSNFMPRWLGEVA